MATPNRIIRDYRNEPEKALEKRKAIIAAERARGRVLATNTNLGEVIPPYYPREPIPAGDPFSPGGTQVTFEELDAELQALITAGGGGSGGGLALRYTASARVPGNGVRYLRIGQNVFTLELGDLLPGDGNIVGVSVAVNILDAARNYRVDILQDPEGGGSVLTTLALPAGQRLQRTPAGLSVPVTGLVTLGARIVRTSGAGASTFRRATVLVEVER